MLTNPILGYHDLAVLLPEILAFLAGITVLGLDIIFRSQSSKRILEAVSATALLLGSLWIVSHLHAPGSAAFGRLAASDSVADWSRLGLAGVGLLTLVLVRQQGQRLGLLHGEFYALLLFSIGGMRNHQSGGDAG